MCPGALSLPHQVVKARAGSCEERQDPVGHFGSPLVPADFLKKLSGTAWVITSNLRPKSTRLGLISSVATV
jgi:hypothetical protein